VGPEGGDGLPQNFGEVHGELRVLSPESRTKPSYVSIEKVLGLECQVSGLGVWLT